MGEDPVVDEAEGFGEFVGSEGVAAYGDAAVVGEGQVVREFCGEDTGYFTGPYVLW